MDDAAVSDAYRRAVARVGAAALAALHGGSPGALDWLFPIALARLARDELERAGADLVYREIEDLSHTYPRDENDRILTWFDPALALPS